MNQIVAAPQTARQMLLAFGMYDTEKGLPSLMGRLDFTGVTRRQAYFSVLGRAPERAGMAVDGPDFHARRVVANTLQGDEFQTRIREIVLGAFPDKRRSIFVHIPKCAGTDLQTLLKRRYPFLPQQLTIPEMTPKPALFEHLRHFASGVALSDWIAISGHVPLRWYTERGFARFEDDVYTTIRHPRDIIYSYISFVLTRCVEFQGVRRHDTSGWLSHVGLTDIEPGASPAYLAELGSKLLQSRKIVQPNLMCQHLGTGTCASALEAMVVSDIEVTDTKRYSAWRAEKFASPSERRLNPSQPLFTPETATSEDRALIEEQISEDLLLYETIMAKLNAQDGLSIRGRVFG
jgi:hypothetical protein